MTAKLGGISITWGTYSINNNSKESEKAQHLMYYGAIQRDISANK